MLAMDPGHSLLKKSSSLWRRLSRREGKPNHASRDARPTTKLRKRTSIPMESADKYMFSRVNGLEHPNSRADSRVVSSDMVTAPFPTDSSQVHTVTWNVPLSAEQVHSLVMGFCPRQMEEKWFIYSEGPDGSGKLKVHFHRSWTGHKIAELFILINLKGDGTGKIVGIKWNGSDQTNGMDGEEAKYMISTTCAWVLGVNFDGR
ncbi:hypothetical protein K469DRAFT_143642 [Zopfia rhizophila CBS 207.26]|uniref:Uncharacterized protein n=1 Tax=Zopfia rhizophila CBS 207.26 TaxID=1314779 RepID=A0A6A6E860_9PEZI|nr:hypothetical protein K469DRAFT_143642 [Zopfia rhizophila CBS 207.26]